MDGMVCLLTAEFAVPTRLRVRDFVRITEGFRRSGTRGAASAKNPRYRTHRRCTVLIADAVFNETITNLPRINCRVFLFVFFNFHFDRRSGDSGLWSSDHSRPNTSCFLISVQNLRHAAVWDAKLTRYLTWTDPWGCHLHNPQPNMIRKRSSIDENTSQLIYTSLA